MTRKQLIAAPFLALSAFVFTYVAYAHISSWLRHDEYADRPYSFVFSDAEALRPFAINKAGPLEAAISGGHLQLSGTTGTADSPSRLELLTPPRRLEDGLYTLRFRVAERGPYDVYLGLSAGNGQARREISATLHNGPDAPFLQLRGDADPRAPREDGSGGLRSFPLAEPPVLDASHELSFFFNGALHLIAIRFDGAQLGTRQLNWQAGELVQPMFGVAGHGGEMPLHAEVGAFSYEPHTLDPRDLDFDDSFSSAQLNPERWAFESFSSDETDTVLTLEKGALHLRSVASSGMPPKATDVVAYNLALPQLEAQTFHFQVQLDVKELHRGSVYLGLSNSGPSHRWFEVGMLDARAYVAGTRGENRMRTDWLPLTIAPGQNELEMSYDAKTRRIRTSANGFDYESILDMQPLEPIVVHIGTRLDARDAVVDVRLLHARFSRPAQ